MDTITFGELMQGVSERLGWPIVANPYGNVNRERIYLAPPDPSPDGVLYCFKINEYRQQDRIMISISDPAWWRELRRYNDPPSQNDFTLADSASAARIATRVLASWKEVQPYCEAMRERREIIEQQNEQNKDYAAMLDCCVPWLAAKYERDPNKLEGRIRSYVTSNNMTWLHRGGEFSTFQFPHIEIGVYVPVDKVQEFSAMMEALIASSKHTS